MDVDDFMAAWRAALPPVPDDLAERAWRSAAPALAPRRRRPIGLALTAVGALAVLGAAVAVVFVRGDRAGTTRATTPRATARGALAGYGIRAQLPPGWRGRIGRGSLIATSLAIGDPDAPITDASLDGLRPGAVGALLFEDSGTVGAGDGASAGLPHAFTRRDFAPAGPGTTAPSRIAYAQQRFIVAGRALTLRAVSGSPTPPATALRELNALVASLRVARGDFYAGTVAPPAFAPRSDWHVRSQAPAPAGPSVRAISAAATVPYADPLDQFPPHATLSRLAPGGVAIWLQLAADDRFPPTMPDGVYARRLQPPYRLDLADCAGSGLEGAASGVTPCVLRGMVAHRYTIDLWVFFAGARPSAAQRAAAQAELDRITLPAWPYWP